MKINRYHRILLAASAILSLLAPQVAAQNVGIGTAAPVYKLHTVGDIYANGGWFRVSGNQGLYWESWGGGFYMSDATWIRTYNDKNIWTGNGLLGSQGGLTVGYSGAAPSGGGGIFAGNVAIGTSAASQRLTVQGNMEIVESFDNVLLSKSTAQGRSHHMIGTYMGWDQGAVFLGGYNANNPSGSYSSANKVICGGTAGSLPIYATNFFTSSSRRLKTGFEPLTYGLDAVMKMEPLSYHYNFEKDPAQRRHLGMIAEDMNTIVPEAVAEEDGKCLGIDYSSLVPVLINAIQEQQAVIQAQNERLQALEQKLEELGKQ